MREDESVNMVSRVAGVMGELKKVVKACEEPEVAQ